MDVKTFFKENEEEISRIIELKVEEILSRRNMKEITKQEETEQKNVVFFEEVETKIREYLIDLGITHRHTNDAYSYLFTGVKLVLENNLSIGIKPAQLYIMIAKERGSNRDSVNGAIRRKISKIWNENQEKLQDFCSVKCDVMPTGKELIFEIANKVK